MSGIDKVTGQNGIAATRAQVPKEAQGETVAGAGHEDSVNLSGNESLGKKIISFPGKVVKETVGFATGLVDSALGIIPSTTGGIQSALDARKPDPSHNVEGHKGDAEIGYGIGYVLEAGAGGAVAGGLIAGPWGVAIGGVGGLVLGGVKMGVEYATGALKRVTDKIENSTFGPISDNTPTGDKMYDVGKDVGEGAIVGMKSGVAENFSLGREKGEGTISGLWEGTKGTVKTLVHREPEPETPAPEKPPTMGEKFKDAALFVVGLPKEILKAAFGIAGGTVGAVLTAPQGLLDGLGQGATHHGEVESIRFSSKLHKHMLRMETTLIGAAVGSAVGPLGTVAGAIAGAIGGLLVGTILNRIEKTTGTDKELVKNMENHLKREVADNKELSSPIASRHRDVIEGAMVGTAAGVKEGFNLGYDAGAGVVQGVADGVKGVAKGLKGAFSALSHPQPPKPGNSEEA
jgi:hypothetical protein